MNSFRSVSLENLYSDPTIEPFVITIAKFGPDVIEVILGNIYSCQNLWFDSKNYYLLLKVKILYKILYDRIEWPRKFA